LRFFDVVKNKAVAPRAESFFKQLDPAAPSF